MSEDIIISGKCVCFYTCAFLSPCSCVSGWVFTLLSVLPAPTTYIVYVLISIAKKYHLVHSVTSLENIPMSSFFIWPKLETSREVVNNLCLLWDIKLSLSQGKPLLSRIFFVLLSIFFRYLTFLVMFRAKLSLRN